MSRLNPFRPPCGDQQDEDLVVVAEAVIHNLLVSECGLGVVQAKAVMTTMLRNKEPFHTLLDLGRSR